MAAVTDDDPHFGIRIMRARAESLGGTLEMTSTPGHGTSVVAVLPVTRDGERTMRILIVDDHALVRRGMSYVVKEGFPDAEVVEAESSAAALEALRSGGKVDLALVDVRMPDLDGLELLRAIKAEWPDRCR